MAIIKNKENVADQRQQPTIASGEELEEIDDRQAINAKCAPYKYTWRFTHEEVRKEIEKRATSIGLGVRNHSLLDEEIIRELCKIVEDVLKQLEIHVQIIHGIEWKELSGIERTGDDLIDADKQLRLLIEEVNTAMKGWLV